VPTELPQRLARRIIQAQGKGRLEQLLRSRRNRLGLGRGEIQVTGTAEQLEQAAWRAVADRHLAITDLAALVDEIEECGAKHVFLFNMTNAGAAAISYTSLGRFQSPPNVPTESFYADQPSARRTYSVTRNGRTFVKQLHTASYWERDESRSSESLDERIVVSRRQRVRAVNVFNIDPGARTAEIRIDRVRNRDDSNLAHEEFAAFLDSLAPGLHLREHLEPLDIRRAFPRIVEARDETFMSIDHASDASARQIFASRRGEGHGLDIRDHPNWRLHGSDYVRDSINVYWLIREGDDENRIHTIVRGVRFAEHGADVELAKAYVPAHITEAELAHVIARIRHFASDAP
jgi:hypothetical protein